MLFIIISVNTDHLIEYDCITISDQPYDQLFDVTKDECKSACAADTRCKHAEYRAEDKRCSLGEISCDEAKNTKQVRVNTNFTLIAECPLGRCSISSTYCTKYIFTNSMHLKNKQ